jgi:hypothetical protein
MSGPKRAVPTQKGRYYTDPQDVLKRYVSVTNVIETINKPALVGWAARTVAEQAVNDLVLVTKISRRDKAEAIAYLKGSPYAAKDAAADLGSRLHKLAEAHELGHDMPVLEDDEREMVQQYLAFREDWQPTYEATEATVCNRTLGYAGTLDGLLRFLRHRLPKAGDGLIVGDYKTGRTGPYPEWGLQLAAYGGAEALWLPDDSEVAMPKVVGGAVIRIRPDYYAVHELDPAAIPVLFEVFTHLIQVTRWLHNDTQQACFSDALIPSKTAAEVA